MVYEKSFITQCTMLIWYIKSILYLPILLILFMKSQEWVLEILGQNQTFWHENEPLMV